MSANITLPDHLLHMYSGRTSVLLISHPVPVICYWGERLHDLSSLTTKVLDPPVGQARLDCDIPLSLCPELGRGDFGSPGIEGHRNGQDWAPVFETTAVTHSPGSVNFTLSDPRAGLELCIKMILDSDSDVLSICHTLINTGSTGYALSRLALTLPLPAHTNRLRTFSGRWSHEFQPRDIALNHGGFVQENRRGRTSHENFPGCIAFAETTSEISGDTYGFHLGWSGNHRLQAQTKSNGRRYIQAEALLMPGEINLAPGESFDTPMLYSCYSPNGFNGMQQGFHHFVRHQILPFSYTRLRPVHFNTWEGIYFDHSPAYINQMADAVARLGVERFIVDDGWFTGRKDDIRALGDWFVDDQKYPDGLQPVIDHVNQLGMEFGL